MVFERLLYVETYADHDCPFDTSFENVSQSIGVQAELLFTET
jgi:hypothetical protein